MIDFVIVCDVSDNGLPYYYCGYFQDNVPVNTNYYSLALKMSYKEEMEILCGKINNLQRNPYKYHVEEHMYVDIPNMPEEDKKVLFYNLENPPEPNNKLKEAAKKYNHE